jgi:hypothetical protein
MTKQSSEGFAPFRGRQGHRRKIHLMNFLAKYLGFDAGGLVQEYTDLFSHVEKHEGRLTATRKAKQWYDISLRLASSLTFVPLSFVKSDSDGYPKILSNFKNHLTGESLYTKRAVLTILQLYKLVDSKGEPTLVGIATPYAGQTHPEWLEDYKAQLIKEFPPDQLNQRISQLKPGYHISGKNGPNGPALGTAHVDRFAIQNTSIESACQELALLTGFDSLYGLLSIYDMTTNPIHKDGRSPIHSRIRIKYESGGKARPFAIGDFFSQSALKAIHEFLMDWLGKQFNDGSSSHDSAAQAVKSWTEDPTEVLYSYDLTEATNRWPLFLEYMVLEAALGPDIARCWKTIVSDRDFTIAAGPDMIRFNCGQPLGLLSSWGAFAVSHHILVRSCIRRTWKEKGPLRGPFIPSKQLDAYRIIGDDIVIRGSTLATRYRNCLTDLDVQISIPKSILPSQSLESSACAELAKRVFRNGKEITPIPPEAVLIGMEPYGFRSLIEQALARDYGTVNSPYSVQSTPLGKGELADITFPFRNRLPLIKGLQSYYEVRKSLNITSDFGSLDPNWFQWVDYPPEDIDDLVRTFLFEQVRSAEDSTQEAISKVTNQTYGIDPYDDYYDEDGPPAKSLRGGDWKPDAYQSNPEILREALVYVQEILNNVVNELYQPGFSNLDFYKFIGRVQVFLDPYQLILGRKARDQKAGTRSYMSMIVKYCHTHLRKS